MLKIPYQSNMPSAAFYLSLLNRLNFSLRLQEHLGVGISTVDLQMRCISNLFQLVADLTQNVRNLKVNDDPLLGVIASIISRSYKFLPKPQPLEADAHLNKKILNVSMIASSLKRLDMHSSRDTEYLTGWVSLMLNAAKIDEEHNQILQNVYGYLWYLTTAEPSSKSKTEV